MRTKNKHFAIGLIIGALVTAVFGVPWGSKGTANAIPRPTITSNCPNAYEAHALSGGLARFVVSDTATHRQQQPGWMPIACGSTLILPRGGWRVEPQATAETLCMSTCEARIFFAGQSAHCTNSCNPAIWPASPTWESREIRSVYQVVCTANSCQFPLQLQLNQAGASVDAFVLTIKADKLSG